MRRGLLAGRVRGGGKRLLAVDRDEQKATHGSLRDDPTASPGVRNISIRPPTPTRRRRSADSSYAHVIVLAVDPNRGALRPIDQRSWEEPAELHCGPAQTRCPGRPALDTACSTARRGVMAELRVLCDAEEPNSSRWSGRLGASGVSRLRPGPPTVSTGTTSTADGVAGSSSTRLGPAANSRVPAETQPFSAGRCRGHV